MVKDTQDSERPKRGEGNGATRKLTHKQAAARALERELAPRRCTWIVTIEGNED